MYIITPTGVAFPPLGFYRQYFCEGPSRLWERVRYLLQEPFSQVQATGIPGFCDAKRASFDAVWIWQILLSRRCQQHRWQIMGTIPYQTADTLR
jgi:hypothetical protein